MIAGTIDRAADPSTDRGADLLTDLERSIGDGDARTLINRAADYLTDRGVDFSRDRGADFLTDLEGSIDDNATRTSIDRGGHFLTDRGADFINDLERSIGSSDARTSIERLIGQKWLDTGNGEHDAKQYERLRFIRARSRLGTCILNRLTRVLCTGTANECVL